LRRGTFLEVLGPRVVARGFEAAAKGHFVERVVGDAFQLPGTFIVDREGIVRYAKHARHAADHPDPSELVAALNKLHQDR
jgi:peroxiredoxin